ncbi:reverse transcriptase domain-containing protein [Tanacetum coccineum]|uniref:Reverse transcriptase domain-containing protein n=1 Tax=Tanacetum coccineum TaxID=301880 RepID=A0ABQ5GKZ8_9ASTR
MALSKTGLSRCTRWSHPRPQDAKNSPSTANCHHPTHAAPPKECNTVTGDVTQTKRQHATKVTNLKVAIHPDYPEQEVSIGGSLSDTGRAAVCALLQRNLDIFAWEPKHMTVLQRSITEHKLKIRQGYSPVSCEKSITMTGLQPVYGQKSDADKCTPLVQNHARSVRGRRRRLPLDYGKQKKLSRSSTAYGAALPTYCTDQGELIMYLSATHGAISAVLLTDRDSVQTPVYFVSKALKETEINYSAMEKLILALVFAAKRLRRYFQAHPVAVITDQPIKQVISKPDASGRLQKWSVLLGEHNISYRPRTAVKGQILADFLIEKPETDIVLPQSEVKLPEPWILFTDGSSCVDGSGAGLILTNPEGMEFTYALRFEFTATNNEAEYEALLGDLRFSSNGCTNEMWIALKVYKQGESLNVTRCKVETNCFWEFGKFNSRVENPWSVLLTVLQIDEWELTRKSLQVSTMQCECSVSITTSTRMVKKDLWTISVKSMSNLNRLFIQTVLTYSEAVSNLGG